MFTLVNFMAGSSEKRIYAVDVPEAKVKIFSISLKETSYPNVCDRVIERQQDVKNYKIFYCYWEGHWKGWALKLKYIKLTAYTT